MIIVSKGVGVLAPILFITSTIAAAKLLDINASLMFTLLFLFNGILWFFVGYKWNTPHEVKNRNGETITIKTRHSLFWIPIQHVGSFLLAIGVVMLLNYLKG